MTEVFGKKPTTSREFPLILFDAGGLLLHPYPTYENFYREQLKQLKFEFSEAQIEAAFIEAIKRLNLQSEQDAQFQFPPNRWPGLLAEVLELSSENAELLKTRVRDHLATIVKIVISQEVVDLCATLIERGYRLAILSNWSPSLPELLRAQGILDMFVSVMTATETGFYKPHPQAFAASLNDLDAQASEVVYIGESYAIDVLGAQRAGMNSILYDPKLRELRALSPEDLSGKVVSLDSLRHNRLLKNVTLITRLDEILKLFT